LKLFDEKVVYINEKKAELIYCVENSFIKTEEHIEDKIDFLLNSHKEDLEDEELKKLTNEQVTELYKNSMKEVQEKKNYYDKKYSKLMEEIRPTQRKKYEKKKSAKSILDLLIAEQNLNNALFGEYNDDEVTEDETLGEFL
jgi:hypothetical protein